MILASGSPVTVVGVALRGDGTPESLNPQTRPSARSPGRIVKRGVSVCSRYYVYGAGQPSAVSLPRCRITPIRKNGMGSELTSLKLAPLLQAKVASINVAVKELTYSSVSMVIFESSDTQATCLQQSRKQNERRTVCKGSRSQTQGLEGLTQNKCNSDPSLRRPLSNNRERCGARGNGDTTQINLGEIENSNIDRKGVIRDHSPGRVL